MKYRVISGGRGTNTHVYELETGKELHGISKAEWSCNATGEAVLKLYCNGQLDVTAEGEIIVSTKGNP